MIKMIAVMLGVAVVVFGEIRENVSPNIRWQEDGKNIKAAPGKKVSSTEWRQQNVPYMEFTPAPNGGFTVFAPTSKGSRAHINIPFDSNFPWLEFSLTDVDPTPGYRAWTLAARTPAGRIVAGQGQQMVKPGIFMFNFLEGTGEKFDPRQKWVNAVLYLYEMKMTFGYWRMVKKPDCLIEISSPAFKEKKMFTTGDKLSFKVILKDPAEDVSLRLFHDRSVVLLNKLDKIQLMPTDKTGQIWAAEMPIQSLATRRSTSFKAHAIMVKATVLGGKIKVPAWTPIAYPFKASAK